MTCDETLSFGLILLTVSLLSFACGTLPRETCAKRLDGQWYQSSSRLSEDLGHSDTVVYDSQKGEIRKLGHTTNKPNPYKIKRCYENRVIYKSGRIISTVFFEDEDQYRLMLFDTIRYSMKRHKPGCRQEKLALPYIPDPYEDVLRAGLDKECDSGNGKSCEKLGSIWEIGYFGPEDLDRANEYWNKAMERFEPSCKEGDAPSCLSLGDAYQDGKNVSIDAGRAKAYFTKARNLLDRACQEGDAETCLHLGYYWAAGHDGEEEHEKAHSYYEKACSLGDPNGCNRVADNLESGQGCAKDPVRAKEFLSRARESFAAKCEGGDIESCVDLADCLKDGTGGPVDVDEALRLYEQAYETGDVEVRFSVSNSVENGPKKIRALARKYKQHVCEAGLARACLYLGNMWQAGEHGPRNLVEARAYYQKACDGGANQGCEEAASLSRYGSRIASRAFTKRACELGAPLSCYSLANMWQDGEGGPQNKNEAARYFKIVRDMYSAGCESGSEYSCEWLGDMWAEGKGVPKKNLGKARGYYKQARAHALKDCREGIAYSCISLAEMWEKGKGIARSAKVAVQYYSMARIIHREECEDGYKYDCGNLADLLKEGKGGPKDLKKAQEYYAIALQSHQKDCDEGSLFDCYLLGGMYEDGEGVPRNMKKAREIYQASCKEGYYRSCRALADLDEDSEKDTKSR